MGEYVSGDRMPKASERLVREFNSLAFRLKITPSPTVAEAVASVDDHIETHDLVVEKFLVESDFAALQSAVAAIESSTQLPTERRANGNRFINAIFGSYFNDVRHEAIQKENDDLRHQLEAIQKDLTNNGQARQDLIVAQRELKRQNEAIQKLKNELEVGYDNAKEELIADYDGVNCRLSNKEEEYGELKLYHDKLNTKYMELSQRYDEQRVLIPAKKDCEQILAEERSKFESEKTALYEGK